MCRALRAFNFEFLVFFKESWWANSSDENVSACNVRFQADDAVGLQKSIVLFAAVAACSWFRNSEFVF